MTVLVSVSLRTVQLGQLVKLIKKAANILWIRYNYHQVPFCLWF